jgi:hypothetical protein
MINNNPFDQEDNLRDLLENDNNYLQKRNNDRTIFYNTQTPQPNNIKQPFKLTSMFTNLKRQLATNTLSFVIGIAVASTITGLAAGQVFAPVQYKPRTILDNALNLKVMRQGEVVTTLDTFKKLDIPALQLSQKPGSDVKITNGDFEIVSISDYDLTVNSAVTDLNIHFNSELFEKTFTTLKVGDVIRVTGTFQPLVSNPPFGYKKIDYILSNLDSIKYIYSKGTPITPPVITTPNTLDTFKKINMPALETSQGPDVKITGGTFEVTQVNDNYVTVNSAIPNLVIQIPREEIKAKIKNPLKPKDVIQVDILFKQIISNPAPGDKNKYYTTKTVNSIKYIYTKK